MNHEERGGRRKIYSRWLNYVGSIGMGKEKAHWFQLKLQIAYLFGWPTHLELKFQA